MYLAVIDPCLLRGSSRTSKKGVSVIIQLFSKILIISNTDFAYVQLVISSV